MRLVPENIAMISLSRCAVPLAALFAAAMASGTCLADDLSGVVLSNLPARSSAAYAELKKASGNATGETLEMTHSEMWNVDASHLSALKNAAERAGVTVRILDGSSRRALAPMAPATAMTPEQDRMMHDTMKQAHVMGMTMMALPPAEVLEYALTKGMASQTSAAETARLDIQLTKSLAVTAIRTSINKTETGYAWHGAVEETGEPVTLIWWADGRLSGNVTYMGHIYSVRSLGGGMHGVIELAPDQLPPDHAPMSERHKRDMGMMRDPLVEKGDASMLRAHRHTKNLEDAPDAPQRVAVLGPAAISGGHFRDVRTQPEVAITVLAAFTKSSATFYSDIERDLIALAIEDANQSFRMSGLGNVRLKLVHAYETDYVENGSHFNHVFRFADKGNGIMDEVHAIRDQYKADVSVLIVNDPMGCGLAAQIRAPADRAFAVVDQGCAATSYSLAHEIGHLIGARHDPGLDDSMEPFSYGHGFVHGTEWRTMMAYKESCNGCARVPVWSSPSIRVKGEPAGDDVSDNARVIAEEATRVADFR